MKRECSIVRDVLPLYFENMVSEDTAVFVKEHLENCSDCAAELECLKSGKKIDKAETSEREESVEAESTGGCQGSCKKNPVGYGTTYCQLAKYPEH